MKYTFKCRNEKCKEVQEVDIPMSDDLPKSIKCSVCNTMSMTYVWDLTSNVIIPERFVRDNPFHFNKKTHKKYY